MPNAIFFSFNKLYKLGSSHRVLVMYFCLGIFSLNKTVLFAKAQVVTGFQVSSIWEKIASYLPLFFYTISNPFFSELRKTSVRSLAKEDSLLGKNG